MKKIGCSAFLALLLCAASFWWPGHAEGQSITWSGSTSPLWNVNGNWFGGAQPGASNTVVFDAASALNLTGTLGADFTVAGLTVGSTPGNVSISGNNLTLGTNGIDMSSFSNSTNNVTIGSTLNLNATSNVNIASGRTLALGAVNIRTGTVTLNGAGSSSFGQNFIVGSNGGTAVMNIQSGSLSRTANVGFYVGNSAGVNATVNQSGGSVSLFALFIGQSASSGGYNLTGGTLGLAENVYVGMNGNRGALTNAGGSLTQTGGAFWVGYNGPGAYSQTSGTASVNVFRMNNTGTMTISGGMFTAAAWDTLASQTNDNSTIILTGGTTTLPVFPTTRGAGATTTMLFDGGVLRPGASSTTYLQGLTNAYLTSNGAVVDTNGQNITIAQLLSNGTAAGTNGALTKRGTGTLTLTGNNTYSGTTTISGGVIQIGSSGTTGSLGSGPVVNNAQLDFARSDRVTLPSNVNISGNGTIRVLSGANLEQAGGSIAGANLYVGQNGGAAMTVSSGSLAISGRFIVGTNASSTATNSGGNVSAGTLNVGWAGGTHLYLQSGTTATTTATNLEMRDASTLQVAAGSLTVSNFLTFGTVDNSQVAIVLSGGTTTLSAFPTSRGVNSTATVTFDGGVLRPGASSSTYMQGLTNAYLTNNGAVVDTNGQNITIAQILSNGTAAGTNGALTKRGTGTLTLSGSNTYSGQTRVSAGVLALGAANAISNQSNLLVDGGGFNLAGFNDTVGVVTLTSGSIFGSGTLAGSSYALQGGVLNAILGSGSITVSTGTTTLSSAGRFNSASALTISNGQLTLGGNETVGSFVLTEGILAGSGNTLTSGSAYDVQSGSVLANLGGSVGLVKSTAGSVALTGNNSFTGLTTISAGTLSIGNGGATGALAGNVLNNAAVIFNRSDDTTYAGNIAGSGNLTKLGAGKLTLTGSSSYAGTTAVSSGALAVNGQVASSVAVASNAVLGGSGIIAGNIGGDGLIAPGNSPGILTVNGQLDATASTAFAFELSQAGAPVWNNASNSVNDVLRLTATSPFTTPLAGTNIVNVYFDVTSLANGDTFLGGFFVDNPNSTANLLINGLGSSSFQYFVKGDGQGGYAYNNANYYTFNQYMATHAGITGVTQSVVPVASANFSDGTITTGQVTQFVIVPEPDTVITACIGFAVAGWSFCKRRRITRILR